MAGGLRLQVAETPWELRLQVAEASGGLRPQVAETPWELRLQVAGTPGLS